ncbi:hypothetical protein [Thermococcus sp. ES12]|uniref:hypothetical protein n=1 Tax=Thermococcus sp. ES12 TaxID=1638246 RepID=UPI00142F5738|nr:hypothetical protein [Thermococcus sp. ES12]NJE76401.1 hypothetical protein [Thermococcus sp. ES12]
MVQVSSLAALLTFLTFFGAGFILLAYFLVLGLAGTNPSFGSGISIVFSLLILLPLTKRLLIASGLDEGASRKLALLVGLFSVLVFCMTMPGVRGWCGG